MILWFVIPIAAVIVTMLLVFVIEFFYLRGKATNYTRLPGRGLRREGFVALTRTWCTLWLADDHVLSVDNHVFSEDYKRFYFRDIQALVMRKTRRGAIWNIVISVFIALWLWIMFLQTGNEERIVWLIVVVIFIVLLAINVLRGQTCSCQLITAVHKETLPSLDRIKTAEKVLGILRQRIRQAQRDLNVSDT